MYAFTVEAAVQSVIVVGVFALVNGFLVQRSKVRDRAADWARQDEVADKAQHQSELLLARQDTLAYEAQKANDTAKITMGKLQTVEDLGRVTHALVNSDKTATMKDNKDQLGVTLVLMKEIVSLKEAQHIEPSEATLEAIVALETRIKTLQSNIDDRLKQQEQAEDALIMKRLGIMDSGEVPVTEEN
jgi:hypothetical protein